MIEATFVDEIKPLKVISKERIKLKKSQKLACKELFSIEAINEAIDKLDLKYKSLNECDVYNIIEYILQKGS